MTEVLETLDVKLIDWTELSRRGLLVKINKRLLHPIGLAICRNEDGTSPGALVADDGKWEYAAVDPKQAWLEALDETIEALDRMDELENKSVLREIRSFIAQQVADARPQINVSELAAQDVADAVVLHGVEGCSHEFVPFRANCTKCDEPYKG